MAKSEKLSRVRINAKTTQESSYKKLLKLIGECLLNLSLVLNDMFIVFHFNKYNFVFIYEVLLYIYKYFKTEDSILSLFVMKLKM